MPRCRDCALYDLDAVKNARGAVMSNWLGGCGWTYPDMPDSLIGRNGLPRPMRMQPSDGTECATFVPRKNA